MNQNADATQLVVIGGGPGGYAAAFLAADLGMQVALVDPEVNPGGVCLYRGCIPSKALLHVAKLIEESRLAANWGIKFTEPKIDIDKLRAWKDSVVKKLTGGLGQLSKQRSVRYIQGTASFVTSNELRIQSNSSEEKLSFRHAILATGSRPAMIPGAPAGSARLLDSTSALDLPSVPKTLLVVGGGYIGLEMGTVYAALGSAVSVVEMTDGLIPGADRDLVNVLAKRLEKISHSIMLKTKVVEMKETEKGIRVKFEGENAPKSEQTFDKVLIAVGRKPNSAVPGIENTKVVVNSRGFVQVNPQRQTTDPNIYAIGDVAGEPLLAHKASHEGRAAVEAVAGRNVAFEPRAIPAVIFTDPEIAWAGLTETEARAQNRPIQVAKFPWAASGRAMTLDRTDGLTKLIVDPETEQVLGMGVVGAGAGELIAEGVLAIEMAALASDLELTIHPHPTLSETVMQAAEVFSGTATDFYRPRKKTNKE
ncbi:MAG: dihydrolipoyl dehydrogenase [Terriglobia bacterium]